MGVAAGKSRTVGNAPGKRGIAKGIVITKTTKSLKLTDNGITKLSFKVVSKAEMKLYKHPMYKPLLP